MASFKLPCVGNSRLRSPFPRTTPVRRYALSMGLETKNKSLLSGRSSWWWNSTRINGKGCVVVSCWWLPLLTGSDAAKVPFFVMRASMPAASSLLASTGPFFLRIRSQVGSPPGSQVVALSQVDGTSSCNGSRSPSSGLLCGGASASCLRFCGGASRLRRHSGGSASGGLCVRLPFRAAPLVCAGPHGVASRLHVRAQLCLVPRVSALRAWKR